MEAPNEQSPSAALRTTADVQPVRLGRRRPAAQSGRHGAIFRLELNALVQRVVVTDHRRQAAEELARRWTQLSPEEILQSPYVLIGTVDEQIEDLHARRERWGISYYVIFEPYVDTFAPVVARLAGG